MRRNASARQLGRAVRQIDSQHRCQFVNEDADAQQKPWKHPHQARLKHRSFYAQN